MKLSDLSGCEFLKDEGMTYEEDGMVQFTVADRITDIGWEVQYDGDALGSIFHYEGTDDLYILTIYGREVCLSVHEDFPLELVSFMPQIEGRI